MRGGRPNGFCDFLSRLSLPHTLDSLKEAKGARCLLFQMNPSDELEEILDGLQQRLTTLEHAEAQAGVLHVSRFDLEGEPAPVQAFRNRAGRVASREWIDNEVA